MSRPRVQVFRREPFTEEELANPPEPLTHQPFGELRPKPRRIVDPPPEPNQDAEGDRR